MYSSERCLRWKEETFRNFPGVSEPYCKSFRDAGTLPFLGRVYTQLSVTIHGPNSNVGHALKAYGSIKIRAGTIACNSGDAPGNLNPEP